MAFNGLTIVNGWIMRIRDELGGGGGESIGNSGHVDCTKSK